MWGCSAQVQALATQCGGDTGTRRTDGESSDCCSYGFVLEYELKSCKLVDTNDLQCYRAWYVDLKCDFQDCSGRLRIAGPEHQPQLLVESLSWDFSSYTLIFIRTQPCNHRPEGHVITGQCRGVFREQAVKEMVEGKPPLQVSNSVKLCAPYLTSSFGCEFTSISS